MGFQFFNPLSVDNLLKMEVNGVFCPHCGEFVTPRTYRRHKEKHFNKNSGSWEKYPSLDEESDQNTGPSRDHEDGEMYDSTCGFTGFDREAAAEEEVDYMEVDTEKARSTLEFWEDAIEDVVTDFNDEDLDGGRPATSLSVEEEDEGRFSLQLALVKWICLFLLFWIAQFQISDNVLELVLRFLNTLFAVCQRHAPWFGGVVMFLPTSVYFIKQRLGLDRDRFIKYVVCLNCHSLYDFSDCFITLGRRRIPKKCSHRLFPNHRHRRFRATCGELNGGHLLKEVRLRDGSIRLYPHKVYGYMRILDTLKSFLSRKDFWSK